MRSHAQRHVTLIGCFLLLAGCASGGSSARDTTPDVLTASQLEDYSHLNAFDAIRRIRPQWLRNNRGQSSILDSSSERRGLRVYVDGMLLGGADDLKSLEVRAIHDVHFLNAREATVRFGTDHAEGALVVRTAG